MSLVKGQIVWEPMFQPGLCHCRRLLWEERESQRLRGDSKRGEQLSGVIVSKESSPSGPIRPKRAAIRFSIPVPRDLLQDGFQWQASAFGEQGADPISVSNLSETRLIKLVTGTRIWEMESKKRQITYHSSSAIGFVLGMSEIVAGLVPCSSR